MSGRDAMQRLNADGIISRSWDSVYVLIVIMIMPPSIGGSDGLAGGGAPRVGADVRPGGERVMWAVIDSKNGTPAFKRGLVRAQESRTRS